MDTGTMTMKITRIRKRLEEIDRERNELPPGNFVRRTELLDEEHMLQAQLAELEDRLVQAGVGIAEKEAGVASDYERVPDLPS